MLVGSGACLQYCVCTVCSITYDAVWCWPEGPCIAGTERRGIGCCSSPQQFLARQTIWFAGRSGSPARWLPPAKKFVVVVTCDNVVWLFVTRVCPMPAYTLRTTLRPSLPTWTTYLYSYEHCVPPKAGLLIILAGDRYGTGDHV